MKTIHKTLLIVAFTSLGVIISVVIVIIINRALRKLNDERRRQIRLRDREEMYKELQMELAPLLDDPKFKKETSKTIPPSPVMPTVVRSGVIGIPIISTPPYRPESTVVIEEINSPQIPKVVEKPITKVIEKPTPKLPPKTIELQPEQPPPVQKLEIKPPPVQRSEVKPPTVVNPKETKPVVKDSYHIPPGQLENVMQELDIIRELTPQQLDTIKTKNPQTIAELFQIYISELKKNSPQQDPPTPPTPRQYPSISPSSFHHRATFNPVISTDGPMFVEISGPEMGGFFSIVSDGMIRGTPIHEDESAFDLETVKGCTYESGDELVRVEELSSSEQSDEGSPSYTEDQDAEKGLDPPSDPDEQLWKDIDGIKGSDVVD